MLTPFFEREGVVLYQGDCRAVMAELPECSIDAIVTDPPYGIGFMGKAWDRPAIDNSTAVRQKKVSAFRASSGRRTVGFGASDYAGAYDFSQKAMSGFQEWSEAWAREALRVLKPGSHMLVCGSPRTYHRLACAIEDAGFEIRDSLMWLFGSGFPKSLDVSKAIDKAAGVEREAIGPGPYDAQRTAASGRGGTVSRSGGDQPAGQMVTAPATDLAREWQGWGTALKPAYEPIVLARKPLRGTVAANVTEYGTGGLNIDGTRIGGEPWQAHRATGLGSVKFFTEGDTPEIDKAPHTLGRWPANLLLDEEAARLLDAQSGESSYTGTNTGKPDAVYGDYAGLSGERIGFGDRGGASRFFYTAKASRSEREAGLMLEPARRSDGREKDIENPRLRTNERRNDHPTVKPIDLMRWLCRLITPPKGLILDPFVGSGSTGMAALDEGFEFVGIDLEARYLEIAQQRIAYRHPVCLAVPPEVGAVEMQGRFA